MISRPLLWDPLMKMRRIHHFDESNHRVTVETEIDVTDIVELNKAQMAATDARERWGTWTKVASIPLNVYFDLKRRGIIDPDGDVTDEKAFLKWLDDPANRAWRVRPGSLSK